MNEQNNTGESFGLSLLVIFVHRGADEDKGMMELCVAIFREASNTHLAFGALVANSQRQLKSFVGCNTMLEPGEYVITALAFNHWSTGKIYIVMFIVVMYAWIRDPPPPTPPSANTVCEGTLFSSCPYVCPCICYVWISEQWVPVSNKHCLLLIDNSCFLIP